MKHMLKPIAVLLALMLLLSGCQGSDTSWVYDLGGEKFPAGAYILYMNQALSDASEKLYQAEMEWEQNHGDSEEKPFKSIFDMTAKEMLNADLEGMSVSDWVVAEAQKNSRRYYIINAKMAEFGIALTPEQIIEAETAARSDFQSQSGDYGEIGVAESSLALVAKASRSMSTFFYGIYGEGGIYQVPEEEITSYFTENYVKGHQLLIRKSSAVYAEDYESPEEEAKAREAAELINAPLKATAEIYLERLKAGEAIEDLQYDLDRELSDDPESVLKNIQGDLDILVRKDDYYDYGETVTDGLSGTPVGECAMLEDDTHFVLVRRLDILENPADLEEARTSIIYDLRYEDDFLSKLEQWGSELPIAVNEASLRRYKPESLMK